MIKSDQDKYDLELQKIQDQEIKWKRKKKLIDKRRALTKSKLDYIPKIKISTTKLIMLYIFINCTVVEIYSMWIMVALSDISGLYALISAVVGETMSFLIYSLKSTKENTEGGIVYEKMKLDNIMPPSTSNNENSTGVG